MARERIKVRCLYCEKLLGIPRHKAGSVVKCPNCSELLIVPKSDQADDLPSLSPKDYGVELGITATAPIEETTQRAEKIPELLPTADRDANRVDPLLTAAPGARPGGKLASVAMLFGFAAIFYPTCITGPVCSVAAIVLGVLGLRSGNKYSAGVGILLGCVSLAILVYMTNLEADNRRFLREITKPPTFSFKPSTSRATLSPGAPFSSKEGEFTVWFPGRPTEQKEEQDTRVGKITAYMFFVTSADRFYCACYNDYPAKVVKDQGIEPTLDDVRNGAVQGIKGKLLEEQKITLGTQKLPGRELLIAGPDGAIHLRNRLFLKGSRLYQVAVTGSAKLVASKEATQFLDSFKVND